MTLGERIQDHRKSAGLSQEALGETLGVTRQSISKWESDAAIPELDKLIAMSRLFRTSVGALLGVEEEGPASEELTERELKALSAIAEKLTPPQPEPQEKKKWPWLLAAAGVLALLLVGKGAANKLARLENQVNGLKHNVNNIDRNVGIQINSITNRVEQILESQNSVTADKGYTVEDADLAAGIVTFRVWAVPKLYREGMTALFTVQSGNKQLFPRYTVYQDGAAVPAKVLGAVSQSGDYDPVSAEGIEGEGHRFEALVTGPLADDITLSVTFRAGEESQNQIIDRVGNLRQDSFPWVYSGSGLEMAGFYTPKEGAPYISIPYLEAFTNEGVHPATREAIFPSAVTVKLWRGERVIWSQDMELPGGTLNVTNVALTSIEHLDLPDLEVGETFYLSALITDTAGRTYETWMDEGQVAAGWTTTVNGTTTVGEYTLISAAPAVGSGSYPWEK